MNINKNRVPKTSILGMKTYTCKDRNKNRHIITKVKSKNKIVNKQRLRNVIIFLSICEYTNLKKGNINFYEVIFFYNTELYFTIVMVVMVFRLHALRKINVKLFISYNGYM